MMTGRAATRRDRAALVALGLGAFTVGTSELVVVGILDPIARDSGVSISAAGTLVTSYAVGVALGGPLLTFLTVRVERRVMLWLGLLVYLAANLVTAVVSGFGLLFISRLAAGSVHGAFIGVASVVAASVAGPRRAGRAISIVFGGVALSTVVGVPLGTFVGQALGWRATFVSVVVVGAVALGLTLALVPPVDPGGGGTVISAARYAFAPRVLATLGVGILIIGGQFTALTYLEPLLRRVTDVSGSAVSAYLLAFGLATAVGTLVGGRAADRGPAATLIVGNAAVAGALGVLYLVASTPRLVVLALVGWGLFGFGLVSTSLQVRVISLAGCGRDLAASLGASAANVGIAAGALAGGQVVAGPGVRAVTLVGAAILALAVPATVAARSLRPPAAVPARTRRPVAVEARPATVGQTGAADD